MKSDLPSTFRSKQVVYVFLPTSKLCVIKPHLKAGALMKVSNVCRLTVKSERHDCILYIAIAGEQIFTETSSVSWRQVQ